MQYDSFLQRKFYIYVDCALSFLLPLYSRISPQHEAAGALRCSEARTTMRELTVSPSLPTCFMLQECVLQQILLSLITYFAQEE